jgi:hypothetical protein
MRRGETMPITTDQRARLKQNGHTYPIVMRVERNKDAIVKLTAAVWYLSKRDEKCVVLMELLDDLLRERQSLRSQLWDELARTKGAA